MDISEAALRYLLLILVMQDVYAISLPPKSRFKPEDSSTDAIRRVFQSDPPINSIVGNFGKASSHHEHSHHVGGAKKKSSQSPRFQQSEASYNGVKASDIAKSLRAINNLLKPEAIDAIKKVTSLVSSSPHASSNSPSANPDRMTSLISSALSSQPSGFDYDRVNKMLDNWKAQLSQTQFTSLLHLPQATTVPVVAQNETPNGQTKQVATQQIASVPVTQLVQPQPQLVQPQPQLVQPQPQLVQPQPQFVQQVVPQQMGYGPMQGMMLPMSYMSMPFQPMMQPQSTYSTAHGGSDQNVEFSKIEYLKGM